MNRTRPKQIVIRVSEEELAQIKEKVEQSVRGVRRILCKMDGTPVRVVYT